MNKAFSRLKWSVLEDISFIQVVEHGNTDGIPLTGHPLGATAATQPTVTEIKVCIQDLEEYEADEFEAPEPQVIRREDGGVVTIADVIEQLSVYIIANAEAILEVKAPLVQATHELVEGEHVIGIPAEENAPKLGANTRIYFEGFFGGIEPDYYALPVRLWAEGEEAKSAEEYWENRLSA